MLFSVAVKSEFSIKSYIIFIIFCVKLAFYLYKYQNVNNNLKNIKYKFVF